MKTQEVISGLNRKKGRAQPFTFLCRCLILISFFLLASISKAQNLVCKEVASNEWLVLDTVLFEHRSLVVTGNYPYLLDKNKIKIESDKPSVEVCYRKISSLLLGPHFNRDIATYDNTKTYSRSDSKAKPYTGFEKEELFSFPGINKFGSISRGVSFGNRQSIFVNSSLNLQIDGAVSDNLFLSAVITDQNIPYQPEGNTQQIRDFDNVFIKLYNDKFDITAGDIVITNPTQNNYFLKYYKNIQGLNLGYRGRQGSWNHQTRFSAAAAKGKFASSIIQPIDGLAGPYRLNGPNGERFIIILANSEKVFLDGKRLKRGFDQDYIIDYNLGEVTFNNHIVITQFSVINIDFEYAEQFYARSNISFTESIENEKAKVGINIYRERDSPGGNLGFNLSDEDRERLQDIGDSTDLAFITNLDTVAFDENRILYVQKDTVDLDGRQVSIFEYSIDPAVELFSPAFTEVTQGLGDYVIRESTSNGRIFDWISPQNGVRQGNYTPGSIIPLPNNRQMITTSVEVKLTAYETVSSEVAFSNTDLNLYSNIDDEDNNGIGYFGAFRSNGRRSFLDGYTWNASTQIEVDSKNFTFIDRYRPILFDRNWNSSTADFTGTKDLISVTSLGLAKDRFNKIAYTLSVRDRGKALRGWQQGLNIDQQLGKIYIQSDNFLQKSEQQSVTTDWVKSKTDISYNGKVITPGYVFEVDQNTLSAQDSVTSSLMNFQSHQVYVTNSDTTKGRYKVSYTRRNDRTPQNGEVIDFVASDNVNVSYEKSLKGGGNVSLAANYRNTFDRLGTFDGEKEVISGRVIWNQTFAKRLIRQNFSYSTGNSRELRREFIYVAVNNGEGTHTWRDTNEDGVQDLNEFFEAVNPDERNFIKLFTPTDDYITAFQTTYLHTISARLPHSWRKGSGFKKFASKLSTNINLNINFKTTSLELADRLNPFGFSLADENIISTQDNKRYSLFFNRNGRGVASDISFQTVDNKSLLTQGFEIRERNEWIGNLKFDLTADYTLRLSSAIGKTINSSDFLTSRNFEITSQNLEPQLIWKPTNSLRLIGSYEWERKQNQLAEQEESSYIRTLTGEVTWNKQGIGSLRSQLSFFNIAFNGDQSTYSAYILLDALQPGRNQTWQLSWQQKVSKGVQLTLLYNGRKSEGRRAINTGNVQVTAFF